MSLIYRGQIAPESATTPTVDSGIQARFLGRPFSIRKSTVSAQRRNYPLQFMGKLY
ncbi:MAG: hypothetical protein VKJ64_00980 [Leptolyngbyaceae bacterium]|nr:hypothetical protein [Leptolyngbyaceae bacterium]